MADFINSIIAFFRRLFLGENLEETNSYDFEALKEESNKRVKEIEERAEETINLVEKEEKSSKEVNVSRRTVLTRLYVLEQKMFVFNEIFPEEYRKFMERIEILRDLYNQSIDENKKELTFQINPEFDERMLGNTIKLEREVDKFLNKQVKFEITSERMKQLIVKLGILYNVSIKHSKEEDRKNACDRLKTAKEKAKSLFEEIIGNEYILKDEQMLERFVNLLAYAEYLIIKTYVRAAYMLPSDFTNIMNNFNYKEAYKTFFVEDVKQLEELISKIPETEIKNTLNKERERLVQEVTFKDDVFEREDEFRKIFDIEDTILNVLDLSGEENVKLKLLKNMDISINEKELIESPIVNSKIALTQIFSKTHSQNILIVLKFLEGLSEDIRYKDIYFILIIFDVLEIVNSIPNALKDEIEKYCQKYPYSEAKINEKKKYAFSISSKEYLYAFSVEDEEEKEEAKKMLESLNLDFEMEQKKILLSSFYFEKLERILNNMKANTKNNF